MSDDLVVDASAILAIFLTEPERREVEHVLSTRTRAGDRLLAPPGLWLEVMNSLVRRHRWSSEEVLDAFREIDDFRIRPVEVGRPLLLLTLDLTERHGLTSYDAVYLALAITQDADLLTLDGDLALAAGDRAVPIGPPRLHETPAVYEHEVTWPRYREAARYLAKLRADALAQ